jgi:hypothetical protein
MNIFLNTGMPAIRRLVSQNRNEKNVDAGTSPVPE